MCNDRETMLLSLSCPDSVGVVQQGDDETVDGERIRIFVGCAIVVSNLLLFLFLNSRHSMRQRYLFFTLVCIGDMLDGGYLIYPSITRLVEMTQGTFYRDTTLWDCILKMNMLFRVFGPELVSTTMLVMSLEKLFAVVSPVQYRIYGTPRARFLSAIFCFFVCICSFSVMFVTTYYDTSEPKVDAYCGVSGSVTPAFALFHQYYNVACQISAFLASAVAFMYAKTITKRANLKELSSIRPILVVSFISCIMLSTSSVIYILMNFVGIAITKAQQNIAVTYCSAVFQCLKFALYMLTGKEFRDSFVQLIKDGKSKSTVEATIFVRAKNISTNCIAAFQRVSQPSTLCTDTNHQNSGVTATN